MQLLYVDDDRINLLLFEAACQPLLGVQVTTAGCGAEALDAVAAQRPDVLVIDLHLPDTDGLALLQTLRESGGLHGVPAFLCSADDDPELRVQAAAAGFGDCWRKPVERQQIAAALAALQPGATP